LLAFVALSRGRVERAYAAGSLWPFGDDAHATANLRSALWRLRQAGVDVIAADKWSLALAEGVAVDVRQVGDWANRLIHGTPTPADLSLHAVPLDALDLLPGWFDDWAIVERERIRQRVLHAMEALARRLASMNRYAEAINVAKTTVGIEPLRESAQRVLLEAHLSHGDRFQAERAFENYRLLLDNELNVGPSGQLSAMLERAGDQPTYQRRRSSTVIPRRVPSRLAASR
jgi:DNA-binding SARP family transcriptional activator